MVGVGVRGEVEKKKGCEEQRGFRRQGTACFSKVALAAAAVPSHFSLTPSAHHSNRTGIGGGRTEGLRRPQFCQRHHCRTSQSHTADYQEFGSWRMAWPVSKQRHKDFTVLVQAQVFGRKAHVHVSSTGYKIIIHGRGNNPAKDFDRWRTTLSKPSPDAVQCTVSWQAHGCMCSNSGLVVLTMVHGCRTRGCSDQF